MTGRTLVYVTGEPGVGKSTLMGQLTGGWKRTHRPRPGRDLLTYNGLTMAVELGRHRPDYPGTDALPMNAVTACERYVQGPAKGETDLLLGEGARLANARFLTAAVAAGWTVHLVHMLNPRAAAQRRADRGSHQAPAWVRGRATAARRLAAHPPPGVEVCQLNAAHPTAVLADTVRALIP